MIKAKAKADRAAARAATSAATQTTAASGPSPTSSRAHTPTPTGGTVTPGEDDGLVSSAVIDHPEGSDSAPTAAAPPPAKDPLVERANLLRANLPTVNRFIRLIAPVLVDVYAASVSIPIRIKSLASLLKAVCFQESDQLAVTLRVCP